MENLENSMGNLKPLVNKLSAAVRLGEVPRITEEIKSCLEEFISSGKLILPASLKTPMEGTYARRLLHHDEELGFVVVAMTWGPGQGTSLHDHDGVWCVEGVVEGEMKVSYFDLLEKKKNLYRFEAAGEAHAKVGGAGALIPPHEYHLLQNTLKDKSSITIHVYGGEINKCNKFVPQEDGWYRHEVSQLTYHI